MTAGAQTPVAQIREEAPIDETPRNAGLTLDIRVTAYDSGVVQISRKNDRTAFWSARGQPTRPAAAPRRRPS